MQYKSKIIIILLSALIISGCSTVKTCKVKIYGSEYITFNKQYESFNNACREVMYELSYSETDENGGTKRPYYKEGAANQTVNGRNVYSKGYWQTKDEDGYEYSIVSTTLDRDEPVVFLETTNPDKSKLVNALREEFKKREFIIKQIYD